MNKKLDDSTETHGLLANGSSGRWDVAVDESLDREEWSLEIASAQVYLLFQVKDLNVVPRALHFLQSGPPSWERREQTQAELTLGRFGSGSVSLLWDNEDFPRCFLLIGPRGRSTLRLSLDKDDIQMLIQALGQVVKDLPEAKD